MEPKTSQSPESVIREIKRKTRRKFNSEEKIRIVLEGLKGEDSIAAICRREGIAPSLYYKWSKTFLQAGYSDISAIFDLLYFGQTNLAVFWLVISTLSIIPIPLHSDF